MLTSILADAEILPETFGFLGVGWWVVHVIAIPLVGYLGYLIGKRGAAKPSTSGGGEGA